MIVLGAGLLIAFLDPGDVHHASAVDLLLDLDARCGASTLTLGEVLVGPALAGVFDDARARSPRWGSRNSRPAPAPTVNWPASVCRPD